MKYTVLLLMFVPVAGVAGALAGWITWNWKIGVIVAGYTLAVCADVCFNGSD